MKKVTSWHDLPYELKVPILAYYIETIIPDFLDTSRPLYKVNQHRRFVADILSLLHAAPELQHEVIVIVDRKIKRRLARSRRLNADLEDLLYKQDWSRMTTSAEQLYQELRLRHSVVGEEVGLLRYFVQIVARCGFPKREQF